jgi:imidazolonepropionase-like amidohydrolase
MSDITLQSRWRTLTPLLVLALLSSPQRAVAQEIPTPIYLINANVLDGVHPEVIRDATVVTAAGRIERIETGTVAVPVGAQVIDLQDRFLLPGLIDAHSHVNSIAGVRIALESGVTTIRTAGVGGYADVGIRDMVKDGLLPGPDIVATGIFVTPYLGDAVLWDERLHQLYSGVASPEQLRRLVRLNIGHGVDWIKTRATDRAGLPERDPRQQVYTESQLRVVVEEAAKAGVPVMVHAHGDEGIRAAVLAGARSIEHATYASEETLQLMKEHGTYLVPTLSSISSFGAAGDYSDPALYLRGLHMAPRRRQVVRRAHELGIKIATGVDTYYGPEAYSRVSREVGLLVAEGISNFDAIRGATSLNAELLGIDSETGSIQPGLDADLIVVDRNPLQDIRSLQDILIVISNGQVVLKRIPFGKEETDKRNGG